jgi:hypothetical protein
LFFVYRIFLDRCVSRNVNNKKCAPKLVFFNEKKVYKDLDDF